MGLYEYAAASGTCPHDAAALTRSSNEGAAGVRRSAASEEEEARAEPQLMLAGSCEHTPAYVSIRQHTSAYVSIRQHTPAYVSIRQHTSAYASIRQHTRGAAADARRQAWQLRHAWRFESFVLGKQVN
jgi:hypothetical protein